MNPLNKKQLRLILIGGTAALVLLLLPVLFPMSGKPGPNWIAALGRFHILVLHFPIALLMIVPVFELLARSRESVRSAILPLLSLATLSAVAATVLGILLAYGDGFSGNGVELHMWGGILTSVLMITTLLVKVPSARPAQLYSILLGLSLISLIFASDHGAALVHGKTFLSEKLIKPKIRITPESSVYTALIQPIFRNHCYECHSSDKYKGDFRMDDFALLLAGGESGMAGIVPGNLEDSEVHYRITLKPSSRGIMPPSPHLPLSPDDIELITFWIESGASQESTLQDALQSDSSDSVITIIQNSLQ
jgi:uncharacterized membrane protein